jgi:hypothetical protein
MKALRSLIKELNVEHMDIEEQMEREAQPRISRSVIRILYMVTATVLKFFVELG